MKRSVFCQMGSHYLSSLPHFQLILDRWHKRVLPCYTLFVKHMAKKVASGDTCWVFTTITNSPTPTYSKSMKDLIAFQWGRVLVWYIFNSIIQRFLFHLSILFVLYWETQNKFDVGNFLTLNKFPKQAMVGGNLHLYNMRPQTCHHQMSDKPSVCKVGNGSINLPIINRKQRNFGPSIWGLMGEKMGQHFTYHQACFWAFIWTNLETYFSDLTLSWWLVSLIGALG